MSDIVLGIDLGTTNSCIAIPETTELANRDELLDAGRLTRVGGALVIRDDRGAATTPSVVWVGPAGEVLVGRQAKQMARLPEVLPPAMFFKRQMGTDQTVQAGHATLTPEEASAHVLRHLKQSAE